MKKRIWNQLKKAVMVTVLAGIMGNCAVSAAEFDTQELTVSGVQLQQSAQWTDYENFQAQLRLEVSGLKELYKKVQEDSKQDIQESKENAQQADSQGDDEQTEKSETAENTSQDEEIQTGEKTQQDANDQMYENMQQNENSQSDDAAQQDEDVPSDETAQSGEKTPTDEKTQQEPARYYLNAYISEYFQVDESGLKHDMQAGSVHIQNQKGQETEITKLTCEVQLTDAQTDTFSLIIPVSLREEYRISPTAVSYPVCQDEPLHKGLNNTNPAGAYFTSRMDDTEEVLAVSSAASLEVSEAKTGITVTLQQSATEVSAGQTVSYVLEVKNTGELSLGNIEISSVFSMNNMKAAWEADDGFTVNGLQGVLAVLQPGETRKLRMTAQLTENQSGELIHTVNVKAKHPAKDENISCQASAKLNASELKAAFEVEKTADRTRAYPGDTITYQICIRNTGERTLHSVLSTERFQNAGIQAKFVQKEGVTLSSNGTQALIPQIAPGEAFALYATVTIPQYFTSQELVNEVTVISDETGTQKMKSRSNVTLTESENTVTVTPEPTPAEAVQSYSSGFGYESKSANAYAAASKPRTGDETEIARYIILVIFAVMSGMGIFVYRKGRKNRENEH